MDGAWFQSSLENTKMYNLKGVKFPDDGQKGLCWQKGCWRLANGLGLGD